MDDCNLVLKTFLYLSLYRYIFWIDIEHFEIFNQLLSNMRL